MRRERMRDRDRREGDQRKKEDDDCRGGLRGDRGEEEKVEE